METFVRSVFQSLLFQNQAVHSWNNYNACILQLLAKKTEAGSLNTWFTWQSTKTDMKPAYRYFLNNKTRMCAEVSAGQVIFGNSLSYDQGEYFFFYLLFLQMTQNYFLILLFRC